MTHPTRLPLLRLVVLVTLALRSLDSSALGFGPLRLQSALGQPLQATVSLIGPEARKLAETCVRSRLTAPDGSDILRPEVELRHLKNGDVEIAIASRASIEEPAATLVLEVTCAPLLHRDFQLLLDLRDGLPHVVAQPSLVEARAQRNSQDVAAVRGQEPEAGPGRGTERRMNRGSRARTRTVSSSTAAPVAADELDAASQTSVPARRRDTAAGTRNILKLSVDTQTLGKHPAELRLSDALSSPAAGAGAGAGAAELDEISLAKARFAAMLRGEDPLAAATTQIKILQEKLRASGAGAEVRGSSAGAELRASSAVAIARPAPAPAEAAERAAPAATTEAAPAPSMLQRMPAFNRWLIAFALMVMAILAVVPWLLRRKKRIVEDKPAAWWASAGSESSREEALLEAARASVVAKSVATPSFLEVAQALSKPASAVPPSTQTDADGPRFTPATQQTEDRMLQRYVKQFLTRKDNPPDAPERIEPEGDPVGLVPMSAERYHPEIPSPSTLAAASVDADDVLGAQHRHKASVTFELVSDVMQEADFWKMLNETQRAIDILEHYCASESTNSPVPWLYLADLYVGNGDLIRHDELRTRFQARFNGRIPDQKQPDADQRHSLEDYPHLMDQISAMWGEQEVVPFLQDLLMNRRDTARQGFDLPVYQEILMLIELARERASELV